MDIINNKSSQIAYEISKKYVGNCYPEFQTFFEPIWKYSLSNKNKYQTSRNVKNDYEGLNFVPDSTILQLANIILPFITGVVSSVAAELFMQKSELKHKEIFKIVQKSGDKLKIQFDDLDKKQIQEIMPYIVAAFSKENPTENKEIRHLEDLLDKDLYHLYNQICNDKEINALLVHIQNAHPNYTSHGPDHSETVIENFEKIIPQQLWNRFSSLEILILLSSAWLHDIGTADFEGKLADCQNEEERKALSQNISKSHSTRSEEYIKDPQNYRRLMLQPPIAEIIAAICKAHVYYDLSKLKSMWGPVKGFEKYGATRVRLLAALLRLGDACDLGYLRVREILQTIYNVPKNYIDSIPHIEGALLVSSVTVKNGSIVIQATPTDAQQREWVKFVSDELEEDFSSVKSILKDKKSNGFVIPIHDVIVETLET